MPEIEVTRRTLFNKYTTSSYYGSLFIRDKQPKYFFSGDNEYVPFYSIFEAEDTLGTRNGILDNYMYTLPQVVRGTSSYTTTVYNRTDRLMESLNLHDKFLLFSKADQPYMTSRHCIAAINLDMSYVTNRNVTDVVRINNNTSLLYCLVLQSSYTNRLYELIQSGQVQDIDLSRLKLVISSEFNDPKHKGLKTLMHKLYIDKMIDLGIDCVYTRDISSWGFANHFTIQKEFHTLASRNEFFNELTKEVMYEFPKSKFAIAS